MLGKDYLKALNLLLFIYGYKCLTTCMDMHPKHTVPQRNQKRALNPLKLEFPMVMSHHVSAGN